ncbi:RagB/SusD family nutrient uptake outer membrane protein [uncultured Chitinophaga sp.]|uniref:RagB/SusD family nutrient uptake outer membrane protein n=1 Tax=uncultured Chitinophaga sp. TaxID=339340 RepID=UPI0025FED912|nr:RagB/SusD family nutrient uptake outer membrane protein [uncultured Chitinophaga sp.]
MKKRFFFLTLFCFSIFTLLGCDKFLEIPPPRTQLITNTVFENDALANSAVIAIYSKLINESGISYRIPMQTGLSGDELTNYSKNIDVIQVYQNAISPLNARTASVWEPLYRYVFQCNEVIEKVENSDRLNSKLRYHLVGEAKFLRAFIYFYLKNMWGEIPLILKTDYKISANAERTGVAEIDSQIVRDLKDAISLLPDNFIGSDGIVKSFDRLRASKWAAMALLSRVSLYRKDYKSAVKYADSVIANANVFYLEQDLNKVFLKTSPEAIFQLQPVATFLVTPEGSNFILRGTPSTSEANSTVVSSALLRVFEKDDKRALSWINSIKVGTNTYFFPFKYKVRTTGGGAASEEYSVVLRLAELYLIRAEAYAQIGEIGLANEDLRVVRKRAGLSYDLTADKDSLLGKIIHERQVEFFCEWGHRWFDLKRLSILDSVMTNTVPLKSAQWDSRHAFFPIPQKDRNNNPNLTQNPGYN